MQVALVWFQASPNFERLGHVKQTSKRSADVGSEGLVCLISVSIRTVTC